MAVSLETLRDHLAYSAWATRRLLEAAAKLSEEERNRDFGTADRSVLGTLRHVYGADAIWLARLHGSAPSALPASDGDLSALEGNFAEVHAGWREWSEALDADAVSAEVAYADMKGNPYRQAPWQIVMHVVNHGTHHRGQAAGFLRAMGYAPPILDLMFYFRQKQ